MMRLGVLKQIKTVRKLLDQIEKNVKSRDEQAVQKSYVFLKALVYHLDNGDLTPESVELHKELLLSSLNKGYL